MRRSREPSQVRWRAPWLLKHLGHIADRPLGAARVQPLSDAKARRRSKTNHFLPYAGEAARRFFRIIVPSMANAPPLLDCAVKATSRTIVAVVCVDPVGVYGAWIQRRNEESMSAPLFFMIPGA